MLFIYQVKCIILKHKNFKDDLMLRQLSLLGALASCLITGQLQAHDMNLHLAPKSDKVISNNTLWTIHATCEIHSTASKKTIRVNGVKNVSHVNGKSLTAGQSTSMAVYAEKTIEVSAEPGAQVTITNLSNDAVEAVCST